MPQRDVRLNFVQQGADRVKAVFDSVEAKRRKLDGADVSIYIKANDTEADQKITGIFHKVELLNQARVDIKMRLSGEAEAERQLARFQIMAKRIGAEVIRPKIDINSQSALLKFSLTKDVESALAAAGGGAAGGAAARAGRGGGGGGWWSLGAAIPLFGGLVTTTGWHVALDSLIEVAAKLGPAAIAAAAFGAALTALSPTVAMMAQREQAMYIATDVLGQKMYGLNGSLNTVNQQFRPGVIQVWGDALTVVNSGTGTLTTLLQTAVPWVDQFAAKLTVDLTRGSGTFMKIVRQGTADLGQLGGILHSVGNAILNLIKVANETNMATGLFGVLGVAAKLLDLLTKLPTPLLAIIAGLHGIYLWGGLAATGLSKISGILSAIPGLGGLKALQDIPGTLDSLAAKALRARTGLDFTVKGMQGVAKDAEGATVKTNVFKTAVSLLGAVPLWGWAAVAAVAVLGIGLAFLKTKSEAQTFADAIDQGIAKANNFQVFDLMASSVQKVNNQLAAMPNTMASASKSFGTTATSAKDFYDTQVAASQKATAASQTYQGENQKVLAEMNNFGKNVGWIMNQFGVSYPAAIGIANAAGVKLTHNMDDGSKAAAVMKQQIMGLMVGYTQLQGPSGIAGKDFEALAYASNDITKKIDQLNSSWSTWMKTVTGTQSGFDTFAQGLTVLSNDSGSFTLHLGRLTVSGKQTKAAIDSLSASGINLNQAFVSEVNNLDTLIAASRNSGATTGQLTAMVKAGIAALIPYAAGSKEATAQLSALAQQVGGPTTTSIKVLSDWAGVKAKDALAIMKKATDDETVAASNLSKTIENLLNVQFQQDIIQSTGASKALQQYTDDLVHNRQESDRGRADRQKLIDDLVAAGLNADQARKFVDGLSTSLGKIPKSESIGIKMTGNGYYTISEGGTNYQISQGGYNSPHAFGGIIRGGIPGRDSVPILAMPGEVVVPTHMVNAGAVDHLRGHLPGFAGGGLVGSGSYSGNVPGLSPFAMGMDKSFRSDMIGSMTSAMKQGLQNMATLMSGTPVANVGSGVMRWAPLVMQALRMEGLGAYLASQVLYQMMTESGGNPDAINLTDSNAAAGDPSRGLLQTIMTTFMAYHWPGTSWNIYDPLANIAAAINYARTVYGPGLMRGGVGMGSGHGYWMGTNNAARGWARVGERGPEWMWFNGGEKVIPSGRVRGGDGAAQIIWNGNVVIQGHALASEAEIGQVVVKAIRAFEKRSGAGWRE